jgi:histidinol phosphatase-like PHP family hydrolase
MKDGAYAMIDLRRDSHVHTAYSSGRDSISALVGAAERADLVELTLADQAGPDTAWLPSYLATIQRTQQRTDVVLRRAIEVEAIGVDGWLAFPNDLSGLDLISVAVNRLPTRSGLLEPDAVRALVDIGMMRPAEVVDRLLSVVALAIERVARYAPTTLARPFDFLARTGIAETEVGEAAMAALISSCRSTGTAVEVSERYRTPSPVHVSTLAAGGVRLLAASDGHAARDVGRWQYVAELAGQQTATPAN